MAGIMAGQSLGFVGGWIVKHLYGGQSIYALLMAGIFLVLAALSVIKVYDPTSNK